MDNSVIQTKVFLFMAGSLREELFLRLPFINNTLIKGDVLSGGRLDTCEGSIALITEVSEDTHKKGVF